MELTPSANNDDVIPVVQNPLAVVEAPSPAPATDAYADASGDAIGVLRRVFFGSGLSRLLPVSWCLFPVLLCVNNAFQNSISIAKVALPFIALCVNATNLAHGYCLCKSNYVARITRENCSTSEERRAALAVLERIAQLSLFIAFLYAASVILSNVLAPLDTSVASIVFLNVANIGTYMPLVSLLTYMYGLWMWICWVKIGVIDKLQCSLTPRSVLDESFIVLYFARARSLTAYNEEWKVWNVVRVTISVLLCWLAIAFGNYLRNNSYNNDLIQGYLLLTFGYLFYAYVWVAISCGALVNNKIVNGTLEAISFLEYDGSHEDGQKELFALQRDQALTRINTVQHRIGMKLGPLVLNIGHVVTVGSVMLTLLTSTAILTSAATQPN